MIDPARGGLVCRACGGARLRISGAARGRIASGSIAPGDVDLALDLVERALSAHAGVG
jgi:DNA repair protein RecO (recombination protein O)